MKERKKRSIIWQIPKSDFEKVIKNAKTITEVLRYFKLSNKGGNSHTVKKRCHKENVDISHIKLGLNNRRGATQIAQKIPLSDILIENSFYNRGHLKND